MPVNQGVEDLDLEIVEFLEIFGYKTLYILRVLTMKELADFDDLAGDPLEFIIQDR